MTRPNDATGASIPRERGFRAGWEEEHDRDTSFPEMERYAGVVGALIKAAADLYVWRHYNEKMKL